MYNKYPYTDFHELNLDWFLAKFKELGGDFKKLYDYVTNYLDSLDIEAEIDQKLEEMLQDGGLEELIKNITTYVFGDKNIVTYDGKNSSYGITSHSYQHYLNIGNLTATPILQGSCYNSLTDRVVMAFGSTDHLQAVLVETSLDLSVVYRVSNVLNLGHANSLTFIPSTNEILVAPADTGTYANKIIVIDAQSLTFRRSITPVLSNVGCIAYDELNDLIYYTNITYDHMAIVTANYDTVATLEIESLQSIVTCTPQGAFCYRGNFYVVWSTTTGITYFCYYNLTTGEISKYYPIPNNYSWIEAEEGFVARGDIYLLSGQYLITMQKLSGLPTVSESEIQYLHSNGLSIANGTDLDTIITPGIYRSGSAAATQTMINYPGWLTPFGFTLYVMPLSDDHVFQILITNGQDRNIATRVCVTTIRDSSAAPTWRRWRGYDLLLTGGDSISIGGAFCDGGTLTGSGKEIFTYVPYNEVATADFINNVTSITGSITVRQNGSYIVNNVDLNNTSIISSYNIFNVGGKIALHVILVSAPSGATNNAPISCRLDNFKIS